MPPAATLSYSRTQIALHWTIVALVVVQWIASDAMGEFFDRVEDGEAGPIPDDPVALLHMASGVSILALMLMRLFVRLRSGAPPPPQDLHPLLQLAARLNHAAFYVILILLPLSGATALFISEDGADLHKLLKTVLLVLIALHVGAVIYHMLIRRDGLLWRILPFRS